MTIDSFWVLIATVRDQSPGDIDVRMDILRDELMKLPSSEVLDFTHHFDSLLDRAYRWDLWGGSWVFMDGGGGDDGFWDFRSALISLGREVFENALIDSDSLADIPEEEVDNMFAEGFQYVSAQVYEKKTGRYPERLRPHPKHPLGEKFDGEDEVGLQRQYPRTYARFWNKD